MTELPEQLRRTPTWDRCREMFSHARIAEATGLDIYFCDPKPARGGSRRPG
jgi:IS30 family transposase